MAISIVKGTRGSAATGTLLLSSIDVVDGDIVDVTIETDANFGTNNHTVGKSSGTATIGSTTQEIVQQTGGQSGQWWFEVTGSGTLVISVVTNSVRTTALPWILTGVDLADPVGGKASGGATTNNLTTGAVTAEAAGSAVIWNDIEWNNLGAMTSSDLTSPDQGVFAGGFDSLAGYKMTSGAGSITANFNAGGGSPADHDWCGVEFKAAAGGGGGGPVPVSWRRRRSGIMVPHWGRRAR